MVGDWTKTFATSWVSLTYPVDVVDNESAGVDCHNDLDNEGQQVRDWH